MLLSSVKTSTVKAATEDVKAKSRSGQQARAILDTSLVGRGFSRDIRKARNAGALAPERAVTAAER